ncbi:ABC transporter ATP-binding protein [Opitutaceae bacterium TAV3]|nr:ABC transporter ATP-binding protein [Opitutaceae bacterium TAV3]
MTAPMRRSRPPLLTIAALTVRRDRKHILRDIHWTIQTGEHWVIMGSNGCGKTSLLKTLTGYLTPTTGDITLLGHRYGETDWRDLRLQIGIVTSALQAAVPDGEPALETVISGRHAQLGLWSVNKTTDADRRDGLKWLRFAGCAPLADRPWNYLSQGERQRVLIARALMTRPRLLILDEPCSGLDPVAREHFLQFIETLARRPRASRHPALVLVTHHIEEITPAFTHALVLRDGRVEASGPRDHTLTSAVLTRAFGAPLRLRRHPHNARLELHFKAQAPRPLGTPIS